MAIVECPHCSRRILPTKSGSCPSCAKQIQPDRGPAGAAKLTSVVLHPPHQEIRDPLSTWSLCCGLVSLVTGPLSGIPAIVTGWLARSRIRRSGGRLGGAGRARTGLVLGSATTILYLALIVFIIQISPKVKRHYIEGNMARGVELKHTLDDYAASNGGDYPPSLATLAAYWPDVAQLKYDPVGRAAPRDWLYFPNLTTGSSEGEIILAGPEHFGLGSARQRIVIRLGGKPEVLDETDFRIQTLAITGAEEQFHQAIRYFTGQQVPRDEVIAMKWLHRSADQGYAEAQSELGGCYLVGKYVRKDEAEATRLYRLAAEQGHAEGQDNLGLNYLTGRGVQRAPSVAADWFRRAAEQGLAPAQMSLGVAYAKGEGVPQDFPMAQKWTRLSAEQGHAPAELNLGIGYLRGEGVPKDTEKGLQWCRKAANQSYAPAMYNLGYFYSEGIGTPRDDVTAYMWFELATDAMNSEMVPAARYRDQLGKRMSADQIAGANRLAGKWRESR